MLYAYAARFDVTKNLKNFVFFFELRKAKSSGRKNAHNFHLTDMVAYPPVQGQDHGQST
jgi:hypothetical protein